MTTASLAEDSRFHSYSTEPEKREMLVRTLWKGQLEKSMVMEDMRVEELDSDFGAVVEILYDPGRFLIPPKRKKKKEHGITPSGKLFSCI